MSEISDTAVVVRLGAEGSYFLLKGAVKGTLYLYQCMKKLQAENILGKGEVEDFEKFLKATEGKYKILNVPTEDVNEIAKMKEDLDRLHISYHVLPDLNVGDGQIQVAYAMEDTNNIESWYRSFCLDHLQAGGEKTYRELMNYTDGQVSIVNIPWPNDARSPEPSKEAMQEAMAGNGFQQGILPDLANNKDGKVPVMVPNYQIDRFEEWYQAYQEEQKIGPEELQIFGMSDYLQEGVGDEYRYMNTAEEKIKEKLQPQKKTQKIQETDKKVEREAGERSLEELMAIHEKISVASLPVVQVEKDLEEEKVQEEIQEKDTGQELSLEGEMEKDPTQKKPEISLEELKEDLNNLHINYAILPDLNAGDGQIQIAYATADAPKMRVWFEAYQGKMLAAGIPVGEMKEMSLEEYMQTNKTQEALPEMQKTGIQEPAQGSIQTEPKGIQKTGGRDTVKETVPVKASGKVEREAIKKNGGNSKNRFNNFDQRDYGSEFFSDLEKAKETRSNFEHALERMEQEQKLSDPQILRVKKEEIQSMTEESHTINYLAKTGKEGEYFMGIAGKEDLLPDGSLLIRKEAKGALVNMDGKILGYTEGKILDQTADKGAKTAKKTVKKIKNVPKL